ncbi:hypothetical protein TNCV_4612211 [Trichonephila clavipes]|nr:hypothetical protein TNCV_4612211 [Trichonephila clavipes]
MECHNELVEVLENNALPYRTVARWIGKFQKGRVSTSDDQRSGRPASHVPSSSCSWITLRIYRPSSPYLYHWLDHSNLKKSRGLENPLDYSNLDNPTNYPEVDSCEKVCPPVIEILETIKR